MYQAEIFDKMAEADDYDQGLTGETFNLYIDMKFKADSIEALLEDISREFGDEAAITTVGDDNGRIDIQVMENDLGEAPTEAQFKQWKSGKTRLWACTYTGSITVCVPVNLDGVMEAL